ncbi:MAG: hypothetical protein OXC27_16070 [Caldilineaceae bacterium]|nr:hypothetical protein [Caldilineaceae bacterium]
MSESNRQDDAQYTLRSTGKANRVRLETVEIVEELPEVGADEAIGG